MQGGVEEAGRVYPVIPAQAGIQERILRRNAPPFFDLPPNVGVRFAHPNLGDLRHFGFLPRHSGEGWNPERRRSG
jgi:hypothetical protein